MIKQFIVLVFAILSIGTTYGKALKKPCKSAHNTWLVINEIMAINQSTVQDSTGEFDDWIELKNNLNHELQLQGLFLSNTFSRRSLYTFPPGTRIPAQGYLIVWCDSQINQQGLHVPFTLNHTGGQLILCNSDTSVIDSVTYFRQYADTSYGLIPNGIGNYFFMPSSFLKMNINFLSSAEENVYGHVVYPNPCRDIFYLELNNFVTSEKRIEIYNSNSQLVKKLRLKEFQTRHEIPTEGLPDGVYYLIINGNVLRRFIIQRE